MKHLVTISVFLACATCVWPLAHAEPLPLWELGAGAAVVSFPDYRGSDRQRSYLLPLPYVVYRGDVLQIDRESAADQPMTVEQLHVLANSPTESVSF